MEILEKFLTFEEKNSLFNFEFCNFKFWQFIRFDIYTKLVNLDFGIGSAQNSKKNRSLVSLLSKLFLGLKNLFKYNIFSKLRISDVIVLNHQRRVRNGNYYECIYTDDFLKKLDYSFYVFEQPYLGKHFTPVYTKNMRYFDIINLVSELKIILLMILYKIKLYKKLDKYICDIKQIENKFYQNFEVQLDFKKLLYKSYIRYKVYSKYYERILRKVSPKVIIELVHYSKRNMIFNDVAKRFDIKVVELQHGTIGKYHIAYNFSEKKKLSTFPDYIFTFGQFWKDNIRSPFEQSNLKVVGWPYLEKKMNEYKTRNIMKKKRTILFVSQGTIGVALSKIAVELKKFVKNDYRIIYKLHPGEYSRWKDEYHWLIDSGIDVIDNNKFDMHYYFSQSDIQVGVYSTALFEGLAYNLKTFIVELYGYLNMEALIKKDIVKLVSNSHDLYTGIKEFTGSSLKDIEYFWASNSIEKMQIELDEIIKVSLNETKD